MRVFRIITEHEWWVGKAFFKETASIEPTRNQKREDCCFTLTWNNAKESEFRNACESRVKREC